MPKMGVNRIFLDQKSSFLFFSSAFDCFFVELYLMTCIIKWLNKVTNCFKFWREGLVPKMGLKGTYLGTKIFLTFCKSVC